MKKRNFVAASENAYNGFDSRTCYDESRSQSGFQVSKNKSGKNSGKKEFIKSLLENVMAKGKIKLIPYKLGTVYNTEKEWHVYYSYYSLTQQKYIPDKIRLQKWGLSPEERAIYLDELCSELNKILIQRNNDGVFHTEENDINAERSFVEWIGLAMQEEDLEDDRKETYKSLQFNFSKFFEKYESLSILQPHQISADIMKMFIKMLQGQNRTNKTINKYLWATEKVLLWLNQKQVISTQPSFEHLHLKHIKNQTGKYPPLSGELKQAAFDYYRNWKDGYYHMFLLHIYYTCIRPKELHRLQVKHFNFQSKSIYVPWYKSKNGLSNHVQILQALYDLLIQRGINKLDPETYVFGAECMPSPDKYEGNYSTDVWIRNRINAGIPKKYSAYGLKHTFNLDYVEHNKKKVDWEWLRRHNRHATQQQTQDYIGELSAYMLDESEHIIINYTSVPGKGLIPIRNKGK